MNQTDAIHTDVDPAESASVTVTPLEALNSPDATSNDPLAALRAEAEELQGEYPNFDLDASLEDGELGPLLRGERVPSLRCLYEATHLSEIVDRRVAQRLDAAVAEALAAAIPGAVAAAVAEREETLLSNIRARGCRPGENGTAAAAGIRLHPAVERLTRRERALLAERAGRGETIRL